MEKQESKSIPDILFDHFVPRGLGACLLFGALAWLLTWAVSAAWGLSAPTSRALGIAQLTFVTVACLGVSRVEAQVLKGGGVLSLGAVLRFFWCLMTPPLLLCLLVSPEDFGLPGSASITYASSHGDLIAAEGAVPPFWKGVGSNLWTDYPVKVASIFGALLVAIWLAGASMVWAAIRFWRLVRWAARSIWNVRQEV